MATEVETLLQDVLAFMQQLLRLQLPQLAETQDSLRALVARLQQADTAFRPTYMDMQGTLRRTQHAALEDSGQKPGGRPESQVAVDDTDSSDKWLWAARPGDAGDLDTSADCSECQDDSADDWPPRGAPSCPRPDLSPDYAVSAAAARERAVLSGVVHRGGPGRWFRVARRGWAALLPAPARLLVFAGPRSSRPRLVLPLVAPGGADAAPCYDPCCAVYAARRRPQVPALELCCPGRKTHKLWLADDGEAQAWVDALRRATQDDSWPTPPAPSTPTQREDDAAALTPASVAAALDADDARLRAGSRSRSQSRAGSAEVPPRGSATECSLARLSLALADQPPPPPPPLTPPPAPSSLADDQQQEYESMLSGSEDIYHDIAPPSADRASYANGAEYAVGPSYANLSLSASSSRASPVEDDADPQARPLYDDVAAPARPKVPDYCNLVAGAGAASAGADEDAENLYDDIGIGASAARTSVYEFIQDPVSQSHLGQSIRCS